MFSGISPWSLIVILIIVVVIFGTKRLRNAGGDLGSAVKNFKNAMRDGEEEATQKTEQIKQAQDKVIDAEAKVKDTTKS